MIRNKEKSKKIKRKPIAQCVNELSWEASVLLFTGLPLSLISLLNLLSLILRGMAEDPIAARAVYPPMLEYILMGVAISVIGAGILDIADKYG